jgi:hypothetical protein
VRKKKKAPIFKEREKIDLIKWMLNGKKVSDYYVDLFFFRLKRERETT